LTALTLWHRAAVEDSRTKTTGLHMALHA